MLSFLLLLILVPSHHRLRPLRSVLKSNFHYFKQHSACSHAQISFPQSTAGSTKDCSRGYLCGPSKEKGLKHSQIMVIFENSKISLKEQMTHNAQINYGTIIEDEDFFFTSPPASHWDPRSLQQRVLWTLPRTSISLSLPPLSCPFPPSSGGPSTVSLAPIALGSLPSFLRAPCWRRKAGSLPVSGSTESRRDRQGPGRTH